MVVEPSDDDTGFRSRRTATPAFGRPPAAGGLVVTVPTDEAGKAAAERILADHGAHVIVHFGKGHWEPLGS